MTRDEIIWLARHSGLTGLTESGLIDYLERFAATVADVEMARTVVDYFEVSERQIAAEREACAALVEQLLGENPDLSEVFIAAEIRARGQG
jgi:hypothetical protein